MRKSRVALIGSGSLGTTIADEIVKGLSSDYEVAGILSGKPQNAMRLAEKMGAKIYETLNDLIADRPDYVIEAASPEVFKEVAIDLLASGIQLIPLSVGALADSKFYAQVRETAVACHSRVHIPSGAVGGFDIFAAAVFMGPAEVSITTEKSPASLNGAPVLKGRNLSEEVEEELFAGAAREAIAHFPRNVNVAVATALAATGVDKTMVTVRSVPGMKSNRHTIRLTGETVHVDIKIETAPSEKNPGSSSLAAYSVIALLKNLAAPIRF